MTARRWRPGLRTILGGITALAALQFALSILTFGDAIFADDRFRLPLPGRVAALAEVFDATDPVLHPALREAVTTVDFVVDVVPVLPGDNDRDDLPMVRVEEALSAYAAAVGSRQVEAWFAPEGDRAPVLRSTSSLLYSNVPARPAVSLADGDWLLVTTRDRLAERIFGFPPGLWAGAFGLLVSALALVALWRGLGPLDRLACGIVAFGRNPVPHALPERGTWEVRRVIRAVNAMEARIAELIAERGVAYAAMSHDLRTYMARLSLRIEAIADDASRAKACAEIEAMSGIVEESLILIHLDDRTRDAVTASVDLRALLHDAADAVDMPLELHDDPPLAVRGDAVLLRRAVDNLLGNALRHAGGGRLEAERDGAQIVLRVLDRGPGIDPADIPRLLQPFERGDRARSLDVAGSGLGLAIVARIARAHGGALDLAPRPGGGLAATLRLPADVLTSV